MGSAQNRLAGEIRHLAYMSVSSLSCECRNLTWDIANRHDAGIPLCIDCVCLRPDAYVKFEETLEALMGKNGKNLLTTFAFELGGVASKVIRTRHP